MKICVIGGSGVIGSKLVKYFSDRNNSVNYTFWTNELNLPGNSKKLNITDTNETIDFLKKGHFDVVIHTAALTNVDLCEKNKALADSINVSGTKNVVEGCRLADTKLVFISTSFVFDGKKLEYFENEDASPATHYGYTKFQGEQLVKNSGLNFLILRTDQPYCWLEKGQHTNSVIRVLETLKAGKILNEIIDWYNTPTYVPDFVNATTILLEKDATGIFHVVGPDYINRYNWSLQIAEIFGLDETKIKPIKSDVLDLAAKRVNVNLKNSKLALEVGIKMEGVNKGALEMVRHQNNLL